MKQVVPIFFFLTLIAISILFFYIIYPFSFSIGGALLLAHLFNPFYHWLRARMTSPRLASLTTTLVVLILVVLPFVGIIFIISTETHGAYLFVKKFLQTSQSNFFATLDNTPTLAFWKQQQWFNNSLKVLKNEAFLQKTYQIFERTADYFFELLAIFVINIPKILINILVLIYLLYYLFIEKENIIALLHSFVPFKKTETQQVLEEISRVINATIHGTIIMGLMEGFFGAMVLFFFSVSSAVLWGIVMTILTMIPLVGANAVLLSVGLYKIFVGQTAAGIGILTIGCGGILIAENIIKPQIVGKRAGLHSSLIVLSSLGAIAVMGIPGFIVGPIIASLFLVAWKQFRQRMIDDKVTN